MFLVIFGCYGVLNTYLEGFYYIETTLTKIYYVIGSAFFML